MEVSDFRYVAQFRNQSSSNTTGVKNRGKILHFLTPCKIYGSVGEMSQWILPVRSRIKPLVYSRPSRRLESWCQKEGKNTNKTYNAFRLSSGSLKIHPSIVHQASNKCHVDRSELNLAGAFLSCHVIMFKGFYSVGRVVQTTDIWCKHLYSTIDCI